MRTLSMFSILGSVFLLTAGCAVPDESNDLPVQEKEPSGEPVQGKVCPGTEESIPQDLIGVRSPFSGNLVLYRPVGDPATGEMAYAVAGTITCTCTSGSGGCSPFSGGGLSGCAMTTCDKCTKSTSRLADDFATDMMLSVIVHPIADVERPCVPESDEADAKVAQFVQDVYGEISPPFATPGPAPDGYAWAQVEVGGHFSVLLLPADAVPFSYAIANAGASVSCSCKSGGSSCPEKSKWPCGTTCDASNCQSCSMSTALVDYGGSVE